MSRAKSQLSENRQTGFRVKIANNAISLVNKLEHEFDSFFRFDRSERFFQVSIVRSKRINRFKLETPVNMQEFDHRSTDYRGIYNLPNGTSNRREREINIRRNFF